MQPMPSRRPPPQSRRGSGWCKWEIANLETRMAQHQAEFRATLERQRAERLMAELLRFTADLMSAREAAARLEGELTALRTLRTFRPWWWRVLTSDTLGVSSGLPRQLDAELAS